MTTLELATQIEEGAVLTSLEASPQEIFTALKYRAEMKNREAQGSLPSPACLPYEEWQARKAWLLDGQPIHGVMAEFFYPALQALKDDNQVEYSRQRDLLFKALRTFLGDGPTAVTEVQESKSVAVPSPKELYNIPDIGRPPAVDPA